MFWDHDAKWCVHEAGGTEIDFRFSNPHTGFGHFTEGISSLKQVTGCDHHDVQQYIVGECSPPGLSHRYLVGYGRPPCCAISTHSAYLGHLPRICTTLQRDATS